MARPLRIEYEGARYHVMCRGNRDISRLLHMGDRSLAGTSRSLVLRNKDLAGRYKTLKKALDETGIPHISG